jgi:hypothetical protein
MQHRCEDPLQEVYFVGRQAQKQIRLAEEDEVAGAPSSRDVGKELALAIEQVNQALDGIGRVQLVEQVAEGDDFFAFCAAANQERASGCTGAFEKPHSGW